MILCFAGGSWHYWRYKTAAQFTKGCLDVKHLHGGALVCEVNFLISLALLKTHPDYASSPLYRIWAYSCIFQFASFVADDVVVFLHKFQFASLVADSVVVFLHKETPQPQISGVEVFCSALMVTIKCFKLSEYRSFERFGVSGWTCTTTDTTNAVLFHNRTGNVLQELISLVCIATAHHCWTHTLQY